MTLSDTIVIRLGIFISTDWYLDHNQINYLRSELEKGETGQHPFFCEENTLILREGLKKAYKAIPKRKWSEKNNQMNEKLDNEFDNDPLVHEDVLKLTKEDLIYFLLTMKSLDLEYLAENENNLKGFRRDTFAFLQDNLVDLDLSNNSIESLPDDIFRDLSKLQSLNLSKNMIRQVSVPHFEKLNGLEVLKLAKNHLDQFPHEKILNKVCEFITFFYHSGINVSIVKELKTYLFK